MNGDRTIRRVRIDRIVVRGRPLAPGDELVLRATLRRGLDREGQGAVGRGSAEQLGATAATAIRDAVAGEVDT